MKHKTIIYLADLANTKFGCSPATVPLAIGYIKAYAVSQLPEKVDIQLFRTPESLFKAIQTREPDIVGCAWYGWNRWLTISALTYIKRFFPDVITVVGGANVPERIQDSLRDFKEFPCIDIMIPNEGEIPFVNLLKIFIQGGKKQTFKIPIDGAFYLSESGEEIITGKPLGLVEDVNIFPSPYLSSCLDQFLDGELMPVLQTLRGCPFHCSFCVSARDSWNRIRSFELERVKAEIKYLEANARNRTIRFADENFGIIPRDLEIARFITKNRIETNYPAAVRVYTHKNINSHVKEITLLLKDLIPMNISCQTLTEPVVKNIKRKNISLDTFQDAVNWAHNNNINATTEIIFGLPGETYSSFMEVINQLVQLRLDSVSTGTLMMLKETEINRPEIIEEYGYEILYSVAERGYTKFGDFENVEIDAWAVKSNFYSFEEYIRINLFLLVYRLFMFWGYFKEMVYMWENRGIKIGDVILEFLESPADYPLFSQQIERLKKCLQDNLFHTKEEVRRIFGQRFSKGSDADNYIGFMSPFILSKIIKGEMLYISNQEKTVDEVIKASTAVFNRCGRGNLSEFLEEMRFAKTLTQSIVISFWETPQETKILSSPYDLISWRNQDYRGELSKFTLEQPIEYQYRINSFNEYKNFIRENSKRPFHIQSEFFFRTFRSNNVRRYISSKI
ncbi:MAG: radical SAM protein [Candidatus Omnitrophota bacterium]|nr:MAG: radical SAM protein [Candidatus Omnitrophota bacterium]